LGNRVYDYLVVKVDFRGDLEESYYHFGEGVIYRVARQRTYLELYHVSIMNGNRGEVNYELSQLRKKEFRLSITKLWCHSEWALGDL
jgi:hypothetical protein